ncbi:MAG: hypothetical protein K2F94_08220 [Muribaculaceae bacterium]|nr:hypothetical protein [Muribaculaceae bacterium]MDE6533305.1 hypothetical protein [Muribaculaceae bacterium]
MKKLFLTLLAVIATSLAGVAQISLDDAYTSLVNLPGMTEKKVDNVQLTPDAVITNLTSVVCKAPRYSQEFVYTYESLPINNMLIGANNQKEMACAFTEPSDNGVYNVFFIVGEKGGQMVAAYGQTNAAGVEAIRNCDVSMEGDSLIMAVAPQIDVVEVITMEYAQK